MDSLPSEAARALAEALLRHAETLDSADLGDIVAAIPAIRAAARQLGDLLAERGWGDDILYDWPGPHDYDDDDEDEDEDEEDGIDAGADLEDFEEGVEDVPLNGARFSYQARFDFVIVNEEALHARVKARSQQVDPDTDVEEATRHYGGPLSLLLYLDNPTFRDYEAAGVEWVYGQEVVRPVERTLDEFEYSVQDDHFPVT